MKLKVRLLTKAERVARAERKQAETSRLEAIADAHLHKLLTLTNSVDRTVSH